MGHGNGQPTKVLCYSELELVSDCFDGGAREPPAKM